MNHIPACGRSPLAAVRHNNNCFTHDVVTVTLPTAPVADTPRGCGLFASATFKKPSTWKTPPFSKPKSSVCKSVNVRLEARHGPGLLTWFKNTEKARTISACYIGSYSAGAFGNSGCTSPLLIGDHPASCLLSVCLNATPHRFHQTLS